ncbi:MAG TPA: polymer-forming cytoskeletal protein [Longimicrobiaceae bacterium]|jgi:cytoskeletal protein CcmA (bactofilin family)|nr:polymer-forming cytoskeletal protein [Longimicrobiaceae bacterium]
MAMFKKSEERTTTALRVVTGEAAISIIGPGMQIEGDLVTEGVLRIEGRVRGTIRAAKMVVLGKDGEIDGDIFTHDAVIGGRVVGTVVAEGRLELQSTCVVDGRIRASAEHLKLDEGARFSGQIEMLDGTEVPREVPPRALPAEIATAEER